jgi:hypothetical protein
MRRSHIASLLTAALFAATILGQTAKAQDPHHPEGGAVTAPQPTTPTQPGMGGMSMADMMRMMQSMHTMMQSMPMMDMAGMGIIDRVEGRIAFLRAELKITDAQANAWTAFADALRTNAQKLGAVRPAMMSASGSGAQQTLAERLDAQERWLAARLDGIRTIKAAFTALYGTLSDDQKKTADELLGPHMGMMQMMSGQMMGRGQMGRGQLGPR